MKVHIFNPQHDLALADGKPWYMAPKSAKKFAADCAMLPVWYANPGDMILAPECNQKWLEHMQQLFPQLKEIAITNTIQDTHIVPWGHDSEVYYQLGITPQTNIKLIEHLSDRIQTCKAFEYLREHCNSLELPEGPTAITTLEQLHSYTATHKNWIIKMPLSGSGKGVIKGSGPTDTGLTNRIASEIKIHGHVMGEPLHNKGTDFAMEFQITPDDCTFTGYSLFKTSDKGIYSGNLLASDPAIEEILTRQVPLENLNAIKQGLINFFKANYQGYTGPIGVDMLTFENGGETGIDPVVEINVRRTMGMVAHAFTKNFVNPGSRGWLRLEQPQKELPPAVIHNGRLTSGSISLCPVSEHTQIAITATITEP